MSEIVEMWRAMREHRKHMRAEHGQRCPSCRTKRPKACPTILLPGQRCRVCGYKDARPHINPPVVMP